MLERAVVRSVSAAARVQEVIVADDVGNGTDRLFCIAVQRDLGGLLEALLRIVLVQTRVALLFL